MTWNGEERASHAAYDGKTKEANNFGQFGGSRARPARQRETEKRRVRVTERTNERTNERPLQQRDATHRARDAGDSPPPTTVRLFIGEHPGSSHPDSPFAPFARARPSLRSLCRLPARSLTCRQDCTISRLALQL